MFRPGQAKGPFVGPVSSEGGGGSLSTAVPIWTYIAGFTYQDFETAGPTNDILAYTLPIGGIVGGAILIPTTAFAGGGITEYEISLGIVGDLTYYLPAYSMIAAPDGAIFTQAAIDDLINYEASTQIRLAATATGDNLDAAEFGLVHLYLKLAVLPPIPS